MTGCKEAPKQQHNAQRSIINLQPKDIEIDSRYSASIRGKQDIKIMPRVSGYITVIHTLEGRGSGIFQAY